MDIDSSETLESMQSLQREVYELVQKQVKSDDITTAYMCAGILMKTAIELYTIGMDDENIENLFDTVKESIPDIRSKLALEKPVLH
jgi:hypothetical protein